MNTSTEMLKKIINLYVGGFHKYKDFKGRSGKFEFWSFALLNTLVSHSLGIAGKFSVVLTLVAIIYGFAVLVPLVAMFVRRVHDTGRSAKWVAAAGCSVVYPLVQQYIPLPLLISGIFNMACFCALVYVLVLTVCPSVSANAYGQRPLENVVERKVANILAVLFFGLVIWHIGTIFVNGAHLPDADEPVRAALPHHTHS